MSQICEICGKKPIFGNTISHAHNKSRRMWHPNIQRIRVIENGEVKRKKVCTRCLRSGKITKVA